MEQKISKANVHEKAHVMWEQHHKDKVKQIAPVPPTAPVHLPTGPDSVHFLPSTPMSQADITVQPGIVLVFLYDTI